MDPFSFRSRRLPEDPGREPEEPPVIQFPQPGHFERAPLPSESNPPTTVKNGDIKTENDTKEFFNNETKTMTAPKGGKNDQDIDPLDAFMAEIEALETGQDGEREGKQGKGAELEPPAGKRHRHERFEAEDHLAEYIEVREAAQSGKKEDGVGVGGGMGPMWDLIPRECSDSDEEVYRTAEALRKESKTTNPGNIKDLALPSIDHTMMHYEDFRRDFYSPCPAVASLSPQQVNQRRRSLSVKISGSGAIPAPIESFEQCGLSKPLVSVLRKAEYTKPTPIQAQALPVALKGRDILGLAPTGSGKSVSFLLPMVVHVMDQRELAEGEGPIALVIAPTRELGEQIHREARRFGRPYNLGICAALGGLQRHAQVKELQAGSEIAVCTPGRWIDLLKVKGGTNCQRVTYLVLDEADRMFDMGFGHQVRAILGQIRPDRQTLMFSATMPRRVQRLAAEALSDPVRITVGTVGAANTDVKQVVHVLTDDDAKIRWIEEQIGSLVDEGDVLMFVARREKADSLARAISSAGSARISALHGDMDQASRSEVVQNLKSGKIHAIIATDIAARGLDIKSVKTVINIDPAKDMDTHIHRVGRCGRAGDREGVAHTLLLPTDIKPAVDLVRCLSASGDDIPQEVLRMAEQDPKWNLHKLRRSSGGGGGGIGGGSAAANAVIGFKRARHEHPLPQHEHQDPWRDTRRETLGQHFRSSFVSAGVRQNATDSKPEILLPKSSQGAVGGMAHSSRGDSSKPQILPPRRPLPPPPVPVSQEPLYNAAPIASASQTARQAEEVARALAKAREIAARLTTQHQGGN